MRVRTLALALLLATTLPVAPSYALDVSEEATIEILDEDNVASLIDFPSLNVYDADDFEYGEVVDVFPDLDLSAGEMFLDDEDVLENVFVLD